MRKARKLTATIAVLAGLLAPSVPATANAAFSADKQVAEMTAIGAKFWRDHGLTHCAAGFHWEWDENFVPGALAEAVVGDGGSGDGVYDCQGWLNPGPFNWQTRDWRTLATRCMVIVHEMGHGEGLEHTDHAGDGIMDSLNADPPRACRVWAKSEVASIGRVRKRTPRAAAHVSQRYGSLNG